MKSVLATLYHGVKILEKQLFFFFKKKPFVLAHDLRGFSPCLASPGPVARQSVTTEGWDRAELLTLWQLGSRATEREP